MFYQNLLFSCQSCIKGHRSNSCNHQDRPLWLLKNKGRPGLAKNSQRDLNKPDLPFLHSPEFITLHSSICRDSSKRKDYYRSEDPSLSPIKRTPPRTTPTPAPTTPTRAEDLRGTDLIYRAPLSDDTFARWVQCCKIGRTQTGANIFTPPTSGLTPPSLFSSGSSSGSSSPPSFSLEAAYPTTPPFSLDSVFPTTTATMEFPSEPLISDEQLDNICNFSPSDFDNLFPLLNFSFENPSPLLESFSFEPTLPFEPTTPPTQQLPPPEPSSFQPRTIDDFEYLFNLPADPPTTPSPPPAVIPPRQLLPPALQGSRMVIHS